MMLRMMRMQCRTRGGIEFCIMTCSMCGSMVNKSNFLQDQPCYDSSDLST